MGIVVSLILIAVGAILTFAVADTSEGINLDAVGWILMAVGLVGFLLTLMFWQSWWGSGMWRRSAYYEGGAAPAPRGYARGGGRRVVVEEEVDDVIPPAGPPPP